MPTDGLEVTLRAHDLRVTGARKLVLGLLDGERYRSAEDLSVELTAVSTPTNISTIYRTLDSLVSHGLAQATVVGGGGQRRYTRAAGQSDLHLVCSNCGTVTRHQSRRLARAIADQARAAGTRVDLPVVVSVRCPGC